MTDNTRFAPDGNIAATAPVIQANAPGAVFIQQQPPTESESERNCFQTRGVDPPDWRDFLRHLGVAVVEVKRGLTVARTADIDEALRRLGKPLAKRKAAAPTEPDTKASALERAGLKRGAA